MRLAGMIRCCPLQAVRTAVNAQSSGDCGRIMIVLLTDGRANVSLAKSNEEPDAIAEGAPQAQPGAAQDGGPGHGQALRLQWLQLAGHRH